MVIDTGQRPPIPQLLDCHAYQLAVLRPELCIDDDSGRESTFMQPLLRSLLLPLMVELGESSDKEINNVL
jgi:hypothetical protein